ncbi:hypothetical protein Syun_012511 [Stephania yunnanensis]|uniref:Uncharacterized protein n=1 Tax=Stephania yunnanensis TaxID=152371 RepID=A0AAP0PJJ4_9MAGN
MVFSSRRNQMCHRDTYVQHESRGNPNTFTHLSPNVVNNWKTIDLLKNEITYANETLITN